MATVIEAEFQFVDMRFEYGRGPDVEQEVTIATRSVRVVGPRSVEVDGSLTLRGLNLDPSKYAQGHKIKAVFTIED